MDFIFASECAPFLISIALIIFFSLFELLSLFIGSGGGIDDVLGEWVDSLEGIAGNFLDWLHIGRAPFLALLILFFTGFALAGYGAQGVSLFVFGFFMPLWIAVPFAVLAALPVVRVGGTIVARLVPREESSAISEKAYLGKEALVTSGKARPGFPAEARLKDHFGQLHYLRVEPEEGGIAFEKGDLVTIISRIKEAQYIARKVEEPQNTRNQGV